MNNELNKELELLADLLDAKVEAIKTNLDKCESILDGLTDSVKKFQSGLMPDSELSPEDEKATDEELTFDNDADKKMEELDADTLENL